MRRLAAALLVTLLAGCPPKDETPPTDDTDGPTDTDGAAPEVTITSPSDGAVLSDPSAVRLQGVGEDTEDGPLGDDALTWTSDVDGDLGTGGLLTVALSLGDHTLTLTGTDTDGNTGTASVDVTVNAENQAPTVAILAPLNDASLVEGTALALSGEGTDPEDGTLPGSSLTWTSSLDGLLGSGTDLSVPSPTLGDHVITLTGVDRAGLEATQAITVHVVGAGQNLPPTVAIATPTQGASFTLGDGVSLSGSATDPEDGALTGGSLVWASSLDGGLGTGVGPIAWTPTQGVHAVTLTATDGDGASRTAQVDITVNPAGNTPPTAEITAPTTGTAVFSGASVSLVGTGDDAEDGPLGGTALAWSSSLDGALGTGSPLALTTLSQGTHRITLTATDSASAVGLDVIDLVVLAPNQPPTATITAPPSGTTATAGDVIGFQGTGDDPEDGTLTGTALRWQSSLDGFLGTGASNPASLSAGLHTVTLTVTDSGGRSDSDSIQVDVAPASVNLPPNASITGSPTASTGLNWAADASGSSDPDGTLVGYAWDFGDGTTLPSGAAPTVDHVFTAAGTYDVVVTVTDDDGATDTDSVQVTVTDPVRVPQVVFDSDQPLGSVCALAVDPQDRVHVVFRDQGHAQLYYAIETPTGWDVELVDGPGFDVGGSVAGTADLALDGATPHVAHITEGTLRYALRTGGSWTVETVPGDPRGSSLVAIALDDFRQGRPTIAWDDGSVGESVAVSWRATGGAWSSQTWSPPNTSEHRFRGGMDEDSTGTWWFSNHEDEAWIVSWSPGAGFSTGTYLDFSSTNQITRQPLVVDPQDRVHVLHHGGLESWSPQGLVQSDLANGALDQVALAWDPIEDEPVALFRNSQGNAEIVRPGPPGQYWVWSYQGPMDAGDHVDIAVDGQGEIRACFFRSGNLVVY